MILSGVPSPLSGQDSKNQPLDELKKLIKKLGADDAVAREEAQQAIIKLIKEQAKLKPNVKILVKELREAMKVGDEEVKVRLKSIIEELGKGKWEKMKEGPLESREGHTSVLSGDKLIIWGGVYREEKYYNDGAIYKLPVIWEE